MEVLSEKQMCELCKNMIAIAFVRNNQHIINKNPELKEPMELAIIQVEKTLEHLSEKQRNIVLERHKEQLVYMATVEAKNAARREIKNAAQRKARKKKKALLAEQSTAGVHL